MGIIDKNDEQVAVMIAFGYATKKPVRDKCRRPINEIVRFVPKEDCQ